MDRIIEVKINGSHLTKDNKYAGVQYEANVTAMRIEFDEGWDGYAEKVTFWNALGQNPVERTLTADLLEDITESTRIYICPIPGEALTEAGDMSFVIDGWAEGKRQRSIEDTLKVRPASFIEQAGEPTDPTPTQAEQLQRQINTLLGDMQEQANIANDAAEDAINANTSAQVARTKAEEAMEAAESAELNALAYAAAAGAHKQIAEQKAAEALASAEEAKADAESTAINAKAATDAAKSAEQYESSAKSSADAASNYSIEAGRSALSANTAASQASASASAAQEAKDAAVGARDEAYEAKIDAKLYRDIVVDQAAVCVDLNNRSKEIQDVAEQSAQTAEAYAQTAEECAQRAEATVGKTPYIGDNGNWFGWDEETSAFVDTGVVALAKSGVYVGNGEMPEGYNVQVDPEGTVATLLRVRDNDGNVTAIPAIVGPAGETIASFERTKGNGAPGTVDTYTMTTNMGNKYTFEVYNGRDGDGAGGVGNMLTEIYDPNNIEADVFRAGGYVSGTKRELITMGGTAFENQTLPFEDGFCDVSGFFSSWEQGFGEIGKAYVIAWDGTEYECECYGLDRYGYGDVEPAIGGFDKGYPFLIMCPYYNEAFAYDADGNQETGNTNHTVSVYEVAENIVPIDPDFMPVMWVTASEEWDDDAGASVWKTDKTFFEMSNAFEDGFEVKLKDQWGSYVYNCVAHGMEFVFSRVTGTALEVFTIDPEVVLFETHELGGQGDASAEIAEHNTATDAHADIRAAIPTKASDLSAPTVAEMNAAIAAIPTPDVSGQINTHNSASDAHADIRALAGKAGQLAIVDNNWGTDWTPNWYLTNKPEQLAAERRSATEVGLGTSGFCTVLTLTHGNSASYGYPLQLGLVKDAMYIRKANGSDGWYPWETFATQSEITTHNSAADAHSDIRELINGKADATHEQSASTISAGTFKGLVKALNLSVDMNGVRNITASTTDLTAGTSALATGNIYLVYE